MLFGTVCDYHVHAECQDGALPNCRQASSHTPGRNLEDIRPVHHWREGNLPPGAKCLVCRKSCWSGECLASWKCEWCGLAVSSTSLAHRNQRRRLDFSISDRNSTAAASSITKKIHREILLPKIFTALLATHKVAVHKESSSTFLSEYSGLAFHIENNTR